jgi:hypothetical protein
VHRQEYRNELRSSIHPEDALVVRNILCFYTDSFSVCETT